MKKLVAIAFLLLLAGCSGIFKTASSIAGEAKIGMSLREFKHLAGIHAELETMTAHQTVYRVDEYSVYKEERYVSGAKLFYFDSQERLYKIDSRSRTSGPGPGRSPARERGH